MDIEQILKKVIRAFKLEGEFLGYEKINAGNINQTYIVRIRKKTGKEKAYICQKLNLFVFKDPQKVMKNIDAVTEYIYRESPRRINVHFHHVITGENYYIDETGFWRLQTHVNSITFSSCDDLDILKNTGSAFGDFQNMLGDFDASQLYTTIKDFHNTPKRLADLFEIASNDTFGRASEAKEEIEWLRYAAPIASTMQEMLDNDELPLRVTHNDPKINNVLFDSNTKEALVVIDLDTVMPGLIGDDFGDAVRFACNTVEEDCPNFEKARIDLKKFDAFCSGFIPKVRLTENEASTLALSCITLTVELASRFLSDYINGDVYFKIDYPYHNLVRARCQIALAKDMMKHKDEMNEIIYKYVSNE